MERVNANELEFRKGNSGPKYLFRGPNIDWGAIRFLPGEQLGTHMHNEVEETFYFPHCAGGCAMIVDGESFEIRPGDAFRIGPGESHNILNDGPEPLEGLFIKHLYRPHDKVSIED